MPNSPASRPANDGYQDRPHRRDTDRWYRNGSLRTMISTAALAVAGYVALQMLAARDDVKTLTDTLPLALQNIEQKVGEVKGHQVLIRDELKDVRGRVGYVERVLQDGNRRRTE